ncbi:MAG: BspA family leucine-rich repeat surface protein [Cytophagales bacterium]|nr:BspA family leucine-rich repeat surface protein [Cytophagales bacterium]
MKRLLFLLPSILFAWCIQAQDVEVVDVATRNEYVGKSYEVITSLKLTADSPGFSVSAATDGNFFARSCPTCTIPFITLWSTTDGQITIPTTGSGYSYDIVWTNQTNPSVGDGSISGQNGNYTITGLENGSIYQVEISGTFPQIYFNNSGDKDKILSVEQWGNMEWRSMNSAFKGCQNLTIPALDYPILGVDTDFSWMFHGSNFNSDIGHWDVTNVKNMSRMFSYTPFDQDIGSWDVQNVEDMSYMFYLAADFTGNVGQWGTKVSNVLDMRYMFSYASLFNDDISTWDVRNVQNMHAMFSGASTFNRNIGNWAVNNVAGMSSLFSGASAFNGNIELWANKLGSVTTMSQMFYGSSAFNRNIGTWQVGSVQSMRYMFSNASTFDQDLGGWDVSSVTDMDFMFSNTSISSANYDALLTGWASLPSLQIGVDLGASNLAYCSGASGRTTLTDTYLWDITGDYQACPNTTPFVTRWNVSNNDIVIKTSGSGYDYMVEWTDLSNPLVNTAIDGPFYGDATINLPTNNQYEIKIWGTFPRLSFGTSELASVESWGDNIWVSMYGGFSACPNLVINAGDNPDLSNVTDMRYMFLTANSMNQDISTWDVSNVELMSGMFWGNTIFNQDISGWNVSNVISMSDMFNGASSFNQDISSWQVSSVTNMSGMFKDAINFNSPINWGTKTSNVTTMKDMFYQASSFNQNIGGWDISSVSTMDEMIRYSSINQANYESTLIGWSSQSNLNGLNFYPFGKYYCSQASKDARVKLINDFGWNINGDQGGCANSIPFVSTWDTTIPDISNNDQIILPFYGEYMVTWEEVGNSANSGTDGPFKYLDILTFDLAGIYQLSVSGIIDGIRQIPNQGSPKPEYTDTKKIVSIDQWGDASWKFLYDAFRSCINVNLLAVDAPNLTNLNYNGLGRMFYSATSLNADLAHWDVSGVSSMNDMLNWTNLSIDNYDNTLIGWSQQSGLVSSMRLGVEGLVYCNGSAARDILKNTYSWDISGDQNYCPYSITVPFEFVWFGDELVIPADSKSSNFYVYWESQTDSNLNGTEGPFTDDAVITLPSRDYYDVSINGLFPSLRFGYTSASRNGLREITQWGDNKWRIMTGGFSNVYNLTISAIDNPDLDLVKNMSYMFRDVGLLNGDLSSWDVSNVELMNGTFDDCNIYSGLASWNTESVTQMSSMFSDSPFNEDISGWDVSNVEFMSGMFRRSSNFDQDLSEWDISSIQSAGMRWLFYYSDMSPSNYSATLNGWAILNASSGETRIPENIYMDTPPIQYCDDTGRTILTTHVADGGFGWTITDGGLNCGGARIDTSEEETIVLGADEEKEGTILYPNPADHSFRILDEDFTGAEVRIFNMEGKEIMRKDNLSGTEVTIETTRLSSGLVMVKIIKAEEVKEFKVLIQH